MDVRFCREQEPPAERHTLRNGRYLIRPIARSPERAQKILCFSVDKDLHGCPSSAQDRRAPSESATTRRPQDGTGV